MGFKQRGSALILTLFILAVVATLAVSMMERLSRDVKRSELYLNDLQAELYAQGALLWASDTLCQHWASDPTGQPLDRLPITTKNAHQDGYRISTEIRDAQILFNLNNLSQEEWQPLFQQLLKAIDPGASADHLNQWTQSLRSFILTHPLTHLSELQQVPGFPPSLAPKLTLYAIALPTVTPLNLAKKEAPLIQLLHLIELQQNHALAGPLVTFSSDYFIVDVLVEKGEQRLLLRSLVQRIIRHSKPFISIIWQARGGG